MTRFKDKVVLVTGGARGLGKAIARRCASEGADIALWDVLEFEGEATAAELTQMGVKAAFHRCDITRQADLNTGMDAIKTQWGRLDGLVNNAALATKLAGKPFDRIDEVDWDRVINVNVKGTWLVTRAAAPLLRTAAKARVVNIASDAALWGADLFLHYVASKGAIIAMTRAIARELGAEGIGVNAVAPGLTETEATQSAPARRWDQVKRGQLLDRRSTPDDIAGAVSFLLSSDAEHITGQVLAVNGGMTFS